jgi:hypothetical protein
MLCHLRLWQTTATWQRVTTPCRLQCVVCTALQEQCMETLLKCLKTIIGSTNWLWCTAPKRRPAPCWVESNYKNQPPTLSSSLSWLIGIPTCYIQEEEIHWQRRTL